MRLLLITASAEKIRRIRKNRFINFQQITMPYLASFVPEHWQVEHVDEECESIDYSKAYDLVGITFHTPSAWHAYDIAEAFRKKGAKIVLGGPHVTLMREEAREHADVIMIGESELTWPWFLSDFETGNYQSEYEQKEDYTLSNLPVPGKEFFHRRDYSGGLAIATRGCRNQCEFCCIPRFYRFGYKQRPVYEVIGEISAIRGKIVILWDENISMDLDYSKELFRKLIPLKKWWSCQASIHAASDEKFLELAAASGCKQLFIGFESISQMSMDGANKRFNRVENYYKAIEKIHRYSIAVQAGIVFGFDEDEKSVFAETIDFLESAGIQNATFNILTPYPGTPLFQRLKEEGRIRTTDWSKYNARNDVVYVPKRMTAEELLEGYRWAYNRFYSAKSMIKRFSKSRTAFWWAFPLNFIYCACKKIYGVDHHEKSELY